MLSKYFGRLFRFGSLRPPSRPENAELFEFLRE